MPTLRERNIPRLVEALTVLDEKQGPVSKDEVIGRVEEMLPPEPDEAELLANGRARWLNNFLWGMTETSGIGWVKMDGRGNWQISVQGSSALADFPDPLLLMDECSRLYRMKWLQKKGQQRRAWLIRGSSVLGANVVPEWLDGGWVSLPASQLRQISPDIPAEDLSAAAAEDYEHLRHQEQKLKVEEILAFVTRVAVGDVVTTTSEGRFYVGDVTGDIEWHKSEEGRSNLRRAVEWRNPDTAVDFADLPDPLPAKLRSGSAIVDLTAQLELVESLLAPGGLETAGEEGVVQRPLHEHLPEPSQSLADELLFGLGWLRKVRDLLDERKQIVFYGPPGTGKTYVAQRLAVALVGEEQVRLVQFHPAYTYEDFFEGYRPEPGEGGNIGFKLRSGPLRRLASDAAEHPDLAYVLIIDEINRADLAKVFGELYFLLEYRREAVQLMYSGGEENFSLPRNLYIIGTMNTADRSIALVDGAMRRRFGFVALDMSSEPSGTLLRLWSKRHNLPAVAADLLDELNGRIDDHEYQIGPSYFMKRKDVDAFSADRLERIWDSDIVPLLQEHFYGQWEAVAPRFALRSLLGAVARNDSGGSREEVHDADGVSAQAEELVSSEVHDNT